MDRFGHSAPSLDELKQIQTEARSAASLHQLRSLFDRVQELRRIHSGNFDVQLVIAEAQEGIIERGRELRSRSGNSNDNDLFETAAPPDRTPAVRSQVAAEGDDLPPAETRQLNSRSWRRATLLALLLTAVICAVFFYLIQTARKINLAPPAAPAAAQNAEQPKVPIQDAKGSATAAPSTPTVRLYTDLIPGTVSVDDGEPQDLKDGELILDHLEPGRHSIKVAGKSGTAGFSFDVADNSAPQAIAPLLATNALAVSISVQDGKGRLLTNSPQSEVSLDGKSIGVAGADGLALDNLGNTDHDLQLAQANDRQRFVLTYTSAPVLTVYLKSDPNAGTVTVTAKQDGVSVFINDLPYRRKTEHGQVRIPLKVGQYVIHVHKDGFIDPPPQSVDIKKAEESELTFDLQPVPAVATLQIRGAAPGTEIDLDRVKSAVAGVDGDATVTNVSSGDHVVELKLDGSTPKRFQRRFQAGENVVLAGGDTALEKIAVTPKPVEQALAPANSESGPAKPKPIDLPGEQVRKGGGFVHYNVPRMAGRYTFQAHSKIGGFLKHEKLQWYAGYADSENYIMFSVDGKHATIREMKDGKSSEVARIPFDASSDEWVQVDMSVKPNSITTRLKTAETGWSDLGTVASDGRDFTQDKVGFYVPGNDEVAVSGFRFTSH